MDIIHLNLKKKTDGSFNNMWCNKFMHAFGLIAEKKTPHRRSISALSP